MTAADVVDTSTGEVFLEANQELTSDKLPTRSSKPASPPLRSSSPSAR